MARSEFEDKIISYDRLIQQSTAGMIGRDWVIGVVEQFLLKDTPRNLLILGEPGCGKTTTMAYLVQRFGFPHHFIGAGSLFNVTAAVDWRDPIRFAESIGYQLLRDYGGWIMDWSDWGISVSQRVQNLEGQLTGAHVQEHDATPLPRLRPQITINQEVANLKETAQVIGVYIEKLQVDYEQAVLQLLVKPLRRIAEKWPQHQLVILVDALDEAADFSNPRRTILALWPNGQLPPNVRFILSAQRPDQVPRALQMAAQTAWLSESEDKGQSHPGVINDAASFVQSLFNEPAITALLAENQIDPDALQDQIVAASQGNFLYLSHLRRDLQSGNSSLLIEDELPQGLDGIYADFWRRIRSMAAGDMAWLDQTVKPLLGTLACAQAPLTRRQLAQLSGVGPSSISTILEAEALIPFRDALGQGQDRRYAFFHPSFSRFLLDPQVDRIDAQSIHYSLADYFLTHYVKNNWPAPDEQDYVRSYALEYIIYHTLHAGYAPQIKRKVLAQILKPAFIRERSEIAGWHMPLVEDLKLVAAMDPEAIVDPGLRILRETRRNSLVNQNLVRLFCQIRPELRDKMVRENRPPQDGIILQRRQSSTDKYIDQAIAALGGSGESAVATIIGIDRPDLNYQVRGVLALSLGETGSPSAIEHLIKMLVTVEKRADNHVSWCAADGLIALDLAPQFEAELVNMLREIVDDPTVKDGAKQRILYILGRRQVRLPLADAIALVHKGLALRSGNGRGRSIDLIYLLLPDYAEDQQTWELEFVPVLENILGIDGQSRRYLRPRWKNEWVLKRAVTALGRIGPLADRAHLQHMLVEVRTDPQKWPEPVNDEKQRQRQSLQDALERAIDDLQRRHL